MAKALFNAKVNLLSAVDVLGDFTQYDVQLAVSDGEGRFTDGDVTVGDIVLFDTSAYELATITRYKIIEIQVLDYSGTISVRIEFNDNNDTPPDLSYSITQDGFITRPSTNFGLAAVPSPSMQLLSDRFSFYSQNYDFYNRLDNISGSGSGGTGSGEAGATGATGMDGAVGPTGSTGEMGPTGQDGIPGATGMDGIPGATGATGADGSPGATGDRGLQGFKGDPGITWTEYTISKSDLGLGSEQQIVLGQIPPLRVLEKVLVKHSESFSGGGLSRFTVEVGVVGETDRHMTAFDVYSQADTQNAKISTSGDLLSLTDPTELILTARCSGGDLNEASTGVLTVWVQTSELP